MSSKHVMVEGTLKPDGTLVLDGKLNLPPGRVQLIVQPLTEAPKDDPFWQMMKGIWAARMAGGHVPRHQEGDQRRDRLHATRSRREAARAQTTLTCGSRMLSVVSVQWSVRLAACR